MYAFLLLIYPVVKMICLTLVHNGNNFAKMIIPVFINIIATSMCVSFFM